MNNASLFSLALVIGSSIHGMVQDDTKQHVSPEEIKNLCAAVYKKIKDDNFTPELLIGIARGGLIPLGYLAGEQGLNNRNVGIMNIASYNDDHEQGELKLLSSPHYQIRQAKSILLIDDLVDTGKTIEFALERIEDEAQGHGTHPIIKVATLFYKKKSTITPDYYAEETDKWVVFPWEK